MQMTFLPTFTLERLFGLRGNIHVSIRSSFSFFFISVTDSLDVSLSAQAILFLCNRGICALVTRISAFFL